MKVVDLVPPVVDQVAFDLYAIKRISDCSGCYVLTNAGGDIVYIGQAVSVLRRVADHFDSSKRVALTVYGRVSMVYWRPEDSTKLSGLERGWVEAVRLREGVLPPLNLVSAPC